MEIKKVISDKKEFLDLLLLADEQEDMIDRYLERGDMFVLYDDGLKALCVVTREGEGVYEIKNTLLFFGYFLHKSALPCVPLEHTFEIILYYTVPVRKMQTFV